MLLASSYRQFRAGLVGTGSPGLRLSGTALESSSIGIRKFCSPRVVFACTPGRYLDIPGDPAALDCKIPKSTQEWDTVVEL